MPPIFNKTGERALSSVWAQALDVLRQAVNVVICGYSLPKTDMYMQYFLKAALGPNKYLSRIVVYDPTLFRSGEAGTSMRSRYSDVFSEQIRGRINFKPTPQYGPEGTFAALAAALSKSPGEVLFLDA